MPKRFAVLKDNVVVNVVLCEDEASAIENFGKTPGYSVVEEVVEITDIASVNYTWDGEKFNYAEAPAEESVDDQSQN